LRLGLWLPRRKQRLPASTVDQSVYQKTATAFSGSSADAADALPIGDGVVRTERCRQDEGQVYLT